MNCDDFRELLDEAPDAERQARMFAHAEDCPQCRARLEFESLLQRQLRTLPIPAPRAGFATRVLAKAHRVDARARPQHTAQRRAVLWATAASLMLALGLWSTRDREPQAGRPIHIALVASGRPSQVQSVRLLFRSDKALPGVTIELHLPDGVELAGYPDQHRLIWQTDLRSGPNLLELPVLVSRGGTLTASLKLGDERRQFSVRVQTAPDGMPRV